MPPISSSTRKVQGVYHTNKKERYHHRSKNNPHFVDQCNFPTLSTPDMYSRTQTTPIYLRSDGCITSDLVIVEAVPRHQATPSLSMLYVVSHRYETSLVPRPLPCFQRATLTNWECAESMACPGDELREYIQALFSHHNYYVL